MSVKYKPYVKFFLTDPRTDFSGIDEIYTGNGMVQPVEAQLGAFFGDCVTTGYGDYAYCDFDIQRRDITFNVGTAVKKLEQPVGFLWVRLLGKDDVYDNGTSYFDFAGIIDRAVVYRTPTKYAFYFRVIRTRNRDFFDLRKDYPDPFDYI